MLQHRLGGFLAALPIGLLPEEVLAVGNRETPPGLVGPSIYCFGCSLDGPRQWSASPYWCFCLCSGCGLHEDVAHQLRLPSELDSFQLAFDLDQPFGVPSPSELLSKVKDWLVSGVSSGDAYLSAIQATEEVDGLEPPGAWARAAYQCHKEAYRGNSCLGHAAAAGDKQRHVDSAAEPHTTTDSK